MGKTVNSIDSSVHTTNSGLENEIGDILAVEVPPIIDAQVQQSISLAASTVLMEGNVAIENLVITKANANVTYAGQTASVTLVDNGDGTWDAVTGIDSGDLTQGLVDADSGDTITHRRDLGDCIVHVNGVAQDSGSAVLNTSFIEIKDRDNDTYSHQRADSLRGSSEYIFSDNASVESNSSSKIIAFNLNGVTLGSSIGVNTNGNSHILHQTLYTHLVWGLTNQDKRYICAYNPITREVMYVFEGSGAVGHRIPNPLGIALNYSEAKNLDNTDLWTVRALDYDLILNDTFGDSLGNHTHTHYDDYTEFDISTTNNRSGDTTVLYGFANSETKVITQYYGDDSNDNFVEIVDVNGVAKRPRRLFIKGADTVGSWGIYDSERGVPGTGRELYLDTPGDEKTNYPMEFLPNGFAVGSTSTNVNSSGDRFIVVVELDTNANPSNPDDTYFNLPTDDSNLNIIDGLFNVTDGIGDNGYNLRAFRFTGSIDFTTCPDGINYIALDEAQNEHFFDNRPSVGLYDKTSADDNRIVYLDGELYDTVGGAVYENDGTDTTGFTLINSSTISSVNNSLRVSNSANSFGRVSRSFNTIIGEVYVLEITYLQGIGTEAESSFRVGSTEDGFDLYSNSSPTPSAESFKIEFVAISTTTYLGLEVGGNVSGDYSDWDNISVFKKQATLGTVQNPLSFLRRPYQVASGTPMREISEVEPLPLFITDSIETEGDLRVNGDIYSEQVLDYKVVFDGTPTLPNILSKRKVIDVQKVQTGWYEVILSKSLKSIGANVQASHSSSTRAITIDILDLKTIRLRIRESSGTYVDTDYISMTISEEK